MSHHLDSPLARQDVRLDITDVYAFRGEAGTALVMNINNSITGPDAPKGFHPEARYELRIDLDGDAREDLVFRWTFGPRDEAGRQSVELRRLAGLEAPEAGAPGTLMLSGQTDDVLRGEGGMRGWVGAAYDPFFIDVTVLKAVGKAFETGSKVDFGSWQPADAANVFAGQTVQSIVLELPDAVFEGLVGPERRIGVWGVTMLATDAGGWRPINRAGRPMIQPIFNPADGERASAYNTTAPADDRANYGALFAGLVASVVAAHETAEDPAAYGAAVAEMVLPDILPYRIGTPASFSFAMRNGRTLTDNAPEVMFSLATNSALSIGLAWRSGGGTSEHGFPYVRAAAREAVAAGSY